MKLTFHETQTMPLVFSGSENTRLKFNDYVKVPIVNYYDGSYTVTPSAEEQTIPIQGKTGRQNIVIEPIPQNYGLISWNGSTLTVS